jgi:hypothetical protein
MMAKGETRSERDLLADIDHKLDQLVGLMAVQGKDQDTQIAILYGLGFDSFFIGRLLGVPPPTVRKKKPKR